MKEREAGNDFGKDIDTNVYNLVIEAWSRSSGPIKGHGPGASWSGEEASVVSVLHEGRESRGEKQEGDEVKDVGKSEAVTVVSAAQRAHDILSKMQDMSRLGYIHVKPDTKSYFLVLKAWVKSTE